MNKKILIFILLAFPYIPQIYAQNVAVAIDASTTESFPLMQQVHIKVQETISHEIRKFYEDPTINQTTKQQNLPTALIVTLFNGDNDTFARLLNLEYTSLNQMVNPIFLLNSLVGSNVDIKNIISKSITPKHCIGILECIVLVKLRESKFYNHLNNPFVQHAAHLLPYLTHIPISSLLVILAPLFRQTEMMKLLVERPELSQVVPANSSTNIPTYTNSIDLHRELETFLHHINTAALEIALFITSLLGNKEIAQLLLEHNISPNVFLNKPDVLAAASFRGHTDIMALLIEHGANINRALLKPLNIIV